MHIFPHLCAFISYQRESGKRKIKHLRIDVFERNFGIIWCFRINSVTLQLQWCDAAAKYGAMYQATMVLCIR